MIIRKNRGRKNPAAFCEKAAGFSINFSQHVDSLFIPSFFIKMLFLVDDFVVKIHIILKLYVALPFTFLYLKHDRGSK